MFNSNHNTQVQDDFLNKVIHTNTPVQMFLMNGYQLKGVISGFDADAVILLCDNREMMIFKHAISTITICNQCRANG